MGCRQFELFEYAPLEEASMSLYMERGSNYLPHYRLCIGWQQNPCEQSSLPHPLGKETVLCSWKMIFGKTSD